MSKQKTVTKWTSKKLQCEIRETKVKLVKFKVNEIKWEWWLSVQKCYKINEQVMEWSIKIKFDRLGGIVSERKMTKLKFLFVHEWM